MVQKDKLTGVISELTATEKLIISYRLSIANTMKALFRKSPYTDIPPFAAALKLPVLSVLKIINSTHDILLSDLVAIDVYSKYLDSLKADDKKRIATISALSIVAVENFSAIPKELVKSVVPFVKDRGKRRKAGVKSSMDKSRVRLKGQKK